MINNDFYDELGTDWLDRSDHPIALLRAENAARAPWIAQELQERLYGTRSSLVNLEDRQNHSEPLQNSPNLATCHTPKISFLDVGCGAGFLTNHLAKLGYNVAGIDLSQKSLDVAKASDSTGLVQYSQANAYSLPFASASFHAVSALDILEHVEEPHLLIAEASRVLKPGGLFFFHTFNRNFLSYLLVIKGVDWFIQNAPKNMHIYPLFIKPHELEEKLEQYNLKAVSWRGLAPNIFRRSSLKMLFTRKVPEDFSFRFCKSLKIGYCGIAIKNSPYANYNALGTRQSPEVARMPNGL